MDGLGDEFLSRAALADDQDGRARGSHLGYQVEDGDDALALSNDVGEVIALLESPLQLHIFFPQAAPLDREGDLREEFIIRPWLGYVVLRAALEGLARHVDRAIRGDEHDGEMRVA